MNKATKMFECENIHCDSKRTACVCMCVYVRLVKDLVKGVNECGNL